METSSPPDHFQGKNVSEHLKEARRRGALATAEMHGTEMAGHMAAAADACKDTIFALLILWAAGTALHTEASTLFLLMLLFSFGFLIWKVGRSSLLGWARMERLHRVIEEERWEIQHHRQQEKEELTELYAAKGFKGKLLEEVVEVLMADDNRLLRVMLEEELGLALEVYEHPLKQGVGAGVGVLIAASLIVITSSLFSLWGVPIICLVLVIAAATTAAKLGRNRALNASIWNVSLLFLAGCGTYFLAGFF